MKRLFSILGLICMCCTSAAQTNWEKAIAQEEEASVSVSFWYWEKLSIRKPKGSQVSNREELVKYLSKTKVGKDLVVIILDKRSEPEGKEVTHEELIAQFYELGFKRVVIQLASGRGRPILSDTTRQK